MERGVAEGNDLQELRDLIAQLKADNERLRQTSGPGSAPGPAPGLVPGPVPASAPERLIFVPRDRKCPLFSGRASPKLREWIEEAEACMRARHLTPADQAFFLYDHLEGEARDELKYRPSTDRADPERIFSVLREVYGCTDSYVALQESFFSRRQQEGESLQEFSLALMSLMAKVKESAPGIMPNAEALLRDQFVEHVLDGALRRELKQMVRRQPTATILEVRGEAIRWEREGLPGGLRGRSFSVPSALGIQYGVQGSSQAVASVPPASELSEIRDLLKCQQEQLKSQQDQLQKLTQSLSLLQSSSQRNRFPRDPVKTCRRCQQPGHFAWECDGVRVPVRFPPPSQALHDFSNQPRVTPRSEN